ncbi:hypothetical protein LCGC14_3080030, partial [marine sediment metagenome]
MPVTNEEIKQKHLSATARIK